MTTPSTSSAESIVVSLELAKQLKKAGYPQKFSVGNFGYCVHTCTGIHGWTDWSAGEKGLYDGSGEYGIDDDTNYFIVAPSAEEILRRLPFGYWHIEQEKNGGADFVVVDNLTNRFYGETLADAAARCYCYLAENNLLPSS